MRNGQQKRMRGRNRRGQNPLTRVYESNGPDVKIRGTAAHIALRRSSEDPDFFIVSSLRLIDRK